MVILIIINSLTIAKIIKWYGTFQFSLIHSILFLPAHDRLVKNYGTPCIWYVPRHQITAASKNCFNGMVCVIAQNVC